MFRGGLRSLLAGEFGALRAEGEAQRAAAARQLAEDQAREKVRRAEEQVTEASDVCKCLWQGHLHLEPLCGGLLCGGKPCNQRRCVHCRLRDCSWRQRRRRDARGRQPTGEPARSARQPRMRRSRSVPADAVLMLMLIVCQLLGAR